MAHDNNGMQKVGRIQIGFLVRVGPLTTIIVIWESHINVNKLICLLRWLTIRNQRMAHVVANISTLVSVIGFKNMNNRVRQRHKHLIVGRKA